MDWYDTDKRFLILVAPTGTGKSLLSVVTQRALQKRTHVVVSTLRLQDQLQSSFAFAPVLKGRDNYECLIADVAVTQAPCQVGFQCAVKSSCDYFVDRESAYVSDFAIFNYPLYMYTSEFSTTFKRPDILFCDESHLAHLELEKHVSAEISDRDIGSMSWRRPRDLTVEGMADWAADNMVEVEEELQRARLWVYGITGGNAGDRIKGNTRDYKRAMSRYSKYQKLARNLTLMQRAGLDTEQGKPWVFDKIGSVYKVRPVFVADYTKYLFGDVDKVVLMTATMNRDDVERLGIDDYDIIEVDSVYEPKRRPVYYRPVGRMSSASEPSLMPSMIDEIDTIIGAHMAKQHKGIIHTVSYKRAEIIKNSSKYKRLMMTHGASDKNEIIRKFKESEEASILISPSILEGEDFPHDQCRYVIMPKVPYLSLGDKVVRERLSEDPNWYTWKAVSDIIQGSGRGMRNEKDFCSIYILDAMFEEIARKHSEDIPQWFKAAIKYLEIE